MKTRVMIVDDQVSVRQMLGVLLPQFGKYQVVAEAGTGLEAIAQQARSQPEIVVFDLALPELNGVGLLQHLRERARDVRTLVYSSTVHRELTLAALRGRPHGFVLKREPWNTFREALDAVASGCSYLTPFATRLLDDVGPDDHSPSLTLREQAVLQMIAEGRSNKEMACQLAISTKTVEHHRAHLMEKLGLHDIASLTKHAVREGLIGLE